MKRKSSCAPRRLCTLSLLCTVIALLHDPCHAWAPALLPNKLVVHSNSLHSVAKTRRRSTELSMGLRSFIGRRIRRRNDDDPDEDEGEINPIEQGSELPVLEDMDLDAQNDMEAINDLGISSANPTVEDTAVDGGAEYKSPPVRMGEDPSSKEINVFPLDKRESAQDRINRVKSGQMTDEEKAAYLRTALSAGSSISRPPLKPRSAQKEDDLKSKASPFPGDPIYRSIAGGKQVEPAKLTNELVDRVGLDMQKKKRDYLDMVTDPHRFDVYRNSASRVPRDESNTPASPPTAAPMPSDLGERLGAAASAAEEQRKKKMAMEVQKREEEAKRQAEVTKRMQEDQRRRQEEMAKRLREKKEQEEQLAAQEQAVAQRKRKEQQEAVMKAQEEYWAKKLAAEREAKQKKSEKIERQTLPDAGLNQSASEKEEPSMSDVPVDALKTEASSVAEEARGDENAPVEPVASTEKPTQSKPDPVNDVPKTTPPKSVPPRFTPSDLNDVKSLNRNAPSNRNGSFAARKTQKDEMVDEQIRRLRELNSPLPSTRSTIGNRPGNNVRMAAPFEPQRPAGARFEPQRVVSTKPASSPSTVDPLTLKSESGGRSIPSSSVSDLLKEYSKEAGPNAKPSPAEKPFDSGSRSTPTPPPAARKESVPTPSQKEPSPPTEATNPIARMFGGVTPRENGFKKPSKPSQPQKPPVAPKASPPPAPAPKRSGPIRMQLPLDDNDDYNEDEEGINSKTNPGMSIAEALKRTTEGGSVDQEERSKKWGIDISKFQ